MKNNPNPKKELGVCLISNKVAVDNEPVGFFYREQPEEELDSGWRFLSGNEDDEYLDNDENYDVYDLEYIIEKDKNVKQYLHSAAGSAFERNPETNLFIPYKED
jgi:hypothetical protein